MPRPLQRLTAWLCLLAALVSGLSPARGFVVCLEPDGGVCVDLVTETETCIGCEADRLPDGSALPHDSASEPACCPCLDFWVPGRQQSHPVPPRTVEFQAAPWLPTYVPPGLQGIAPPVAGVLIDDWGDAPRPHASLALIRSVVLLV